MEYIAAIVIAVITNPKASAYLVAVLLVISIAMPNLTIWSMPVGICRVTEGHANARSHFNDTYHASQAIVEHALSHVTRPVSGLLLDQLAELVFVDSSYPWNVRWCSSSDHIDFVKQLCGILTDGEEKLKQQETMDAYFGPNYTPLTPLVRRKGVPAPVQRLIEQRWALNEEWTRERGIPDIERLRPLGAQLIGIRNNFVAQFSRINRRFNQTLQRELAKP